MLPDIRHGGIKHLRMIQPALKYNFWLMILYAIYTCTEEKTAEETVDFKQKLKS